MAKRRFLAEELSIFLGGKQDRDFGGEKARGGGREKSESKGVTWSLRVFNEKLRNPN